jgi:SagB-type dehydrogenase family enzyme
MPKDLWQEILLSSGNEDHVWELLHENSKLGKNTSGLTDQEVRIRMGEFHESLPFEGYPTVELAKSLDYLPISLDKALVDRRSIRDLSQCRLTLESLSTLLHYAYGVTRDNKDTTFPRPFRIVPSGGALYPLEIFFHSACIEGLRPGLYHYNSSKSHLCLLKEGDASQTISDALVRSDIAHHASLFIFISAIFERSVFKYGDRGYRFIFLEAGHVAQNVNLVASALGLASVNIGGFYDRCVDDFLGLDGLTHSTIYMIAIGKETKAASQDGSE